MRKNQIVVDFDADIGTRFGTIVFIDGSTKRATVDLEDGYTWENVEFFYHCEPDNTEDGHSAFSVGDEVLLAEAGTERIIIGFKDLMPRPCFKKRFFVQINKGTPTVPTYAYYWLRISFDGTSVKASEAFDTESLMEMSLTPKENDHVATKSFMLEDERWVAGPHILMKDRIQRFNLMGYPKLEVEYIPDAHYPRPSLCLGGMPRGHPCPPNRFYCNCANGVMVWYSCYTVIDPVPPNSLIHYCFGIVVKAKASMILEPYESPSGTKYQKLLDPGTGKELIKTFNCCSSEVDAEGFEGLWYYEKPDPDCLPPDPDPMCGADADVPYQMLLDVNSLDENTLEVFVPWRERPTKFTVDLTGPGVGTTESDHTYEVVTETDHWYWTEDGFKQEKFVNLEYSSIAGGVVDYSDSPAPTPHPGCDGSSPVVYCEFYVPCPEKTAAEMGCTTGCDGHLGNVKETFSGTWERVYYRIPGSGKYHKETIYEIFLPGKTAKMTSRDWEIVTVQGKYSETEGCYANWAIIGTIKIGVNWYYIWELTCEGPNPFNSAASIRYIGETLLQKLADSVNADWCSPNVVFVGSSKDRIFVDAFEEIGRYKRSESTVTGGNINHVDSSGYAQLESDEVFEDSYWGVGDSGISICGDGWPVSSFMSYNGVDLWGIPVDLEVFSVSTSIVGYGGGDPFSDVFIDPHFNRKKSSNENTLEEPLALEYNVDGETVFSEKDISGNLLVNRTFYLDDRATEDSHGIITAGAGITPGAFNWNTMEYNPDIPFYWKIRWAPKEGADQDITDKVMGALGCEVWQLCKIGLI